MKTITNYIVEKASFLVKKHVNPNITNDILDITKFEDMKPNNWIAMAYKNSPDIIRSIFFATGTIKKGNGFSGSYDVSEGPIIEIARDNDNERYFIYHTNSLSYHYGHWTPVKFTDEARNMINEFVMRYDMSELKNVKVSQPRKIGTIHKDGKIDLEV